MRVTTVPLCILVALTASSTLAARADWHLRGVVSTNAVLADVLAANARASGSGDARFAQRHERWTYTTGTRRIGVTVAVRDDDFRTSLELDGLTFTAGRVGGARWRGDGNGIVHGVEADLQGDALDRAPQAVFPIDRAACTLIGAAQLPAPAWVVQTNPAGDKPAFLYIDEATGSIVREVMRDGKRVVTTDFDRFETMDGARRARHWRVDDGRGADALDVTVDSSEAGRVAASEVAFPARRLFTAVAPLAQSAELVASFERDVINIEVFIDGKRRPFILDTGTTSISVDPELSNRYGGTTLEHAVLPLVAIGPLQLDRVSVLTVPYNGRSILGLDFFFGHVIEVDYRRQRVRVLSPHDAQAVFSDPKTTVLEANVDQGLPLVHAGFGLAQSDTFAIDTGSPRLYVMRPFMTRFAHEIAAHWTPAGSSYLDGYLEGGIEVQPFSVAHFDFANAHAQDLIVGGQVPTNRTDDLSIPFDGIIGTDILRNFDFYFDYDNGRLGVRQEESTIFAALLHY